MNASPSPSSPSSDADAARIVRDGLSQHGFTLAGVRERLPWLNFLEELWRSARRFHLPPPADARDELISLFLAGASAPADRLTERLSAEWTEAARRLQLLRREGDRYVPTRALVPGDDGWTSCRPPPTVDPAAPEAAVCFPAWPATACDLWMLHGLGHEPVERAVAVGDDPALFAKALAVSAQEVGVLCLSPVQAYAASADFAFRGLTNVRALSASGVLAPGQRIAGRFSISAAVASGAAFTEGQGRGWLQERSETLATLLEVVVEKHLAEGGEALLSVELPVSSAGAAASIERHVAAAGLTGVFFRATSEEVGAWTSERLRGLQHVAQAEYARRLTAALDGWRAGCVERIETGVLCLTKGKAITFRFDHVDDPRHLPWAEARRRVFAQQERIEREWNLDDPEGRKALLETYFRTRESVAADQNVLFHEGRWQITGAKASLMEGLGYTGTIDFLLLQTLPLLNGKRPLGDVVDKLFRVLKIPREQAEPTLLRNLLQLIARGMVEPVEPEAPAVGLPGAFSSSAG